MQTVWAPLPPHMEATWRVLGLQQADGDAEFRAIVERAEAAVAQAPGMPRRRAARDGPKG
jgi:hypothetical protein